MKRTSEPPSPNYFVAMKIPLVAGRLFDELVDAHHTYDVMVNQAWVDRYSRGINPLGRRIRFAISAVGQEREIVGIAANAADGGLDSADAAAVSCRSPRTLRPSSTTSSVSPGIPCPHFSDTRCTSGIRSTVGGDGSNHHGPDHRPITLRIPATLSVLPNREFRRACLDPGDGRLVRTNLALGHTALAGTGNPRRAGGSTIGRHAPHTRRGRSTGAARYRHRRGRGSAPRN